MVVGVGYVIMKKRILSLLLVAIMACSICACGGSENTSGGLFETEKEIEITIDNWQEYFEIKSEFLYNTRKDDFGEEIEDEIEFDYSTFLCLKDEYKDGWVSADIVVEYDSNQAKGYVVEGDFTNQSCTIEETLEFDEAFADLSNKIETVKMRDYQTILHFQGGAVCGENKYEGKATKRLIYSYPDIEITRIKGTLVIKE